MIAKLVALQPEIARLCQQYGVRRLDVFGSAATGDHDPLKSDFDFVIDFADYGPGIGTRFIAFADALESLLGRSVDLVFDRSMKTRMRDFIEPQREVVFEASDGSIAA